ncbi:MAG: hypothetical protein ACYS21_19715, partial [Planctomycetota bacterium]
MRNDNKKPVVARMRGNLSYQKLQRASILLLLVVLCALASFNTPTFLTWYNLVDSPNSEMAVAYLDGKIYIVGGYPSTRISV